MTDEWVIRLPYTRPPLSLNDRMHWAPKGKITREIRDYVREACWYRVPTLERAHIELHWVPRDRRRRDTDNPYPTLKAAIDGIRDATVIADDDSTRVTSAVVIDDPDPKDPHIYLRIERRT